MHTIQQVFTRLGKLVDNETYRSATSLNLLIYDYLLTVLMTTTIEVYGLHTTKPAFTCSKLARETLEQRFEICLKLTIKTPKRRHWRRFGVFIVNFEHISNLCSSVSNCWLGNSLALLINYVWSLLN